MISQPIFISLLSPVISFLSNKTNNSTDVAFRCCLLPGHVIGSPSPLIKEIKPEEIVDLKKRFSGRQQTNAQSKHPSPSPPADATTLEKEVAAQGDTVRNLKASKAEKKTIDEAVAKLLDLKKQLAACQTAPSAVLAQVKVTNVDPGQLEKDVAAQGEVVRNLKAAKADKKDIDASVAKLLDLKKQLSTATGLEPVDAHSGSHKTKGGKKK